MEYSNFTQFTATEWHCPGQVTVSGVLYTYDLWNINKLAPEIGYDRIQVSEETEAEQFTIMTGVTIPTENALIYGIPGTNLRFLPFLYRAEQLRVSVFCGLSLMGTYSTYYQDFGGFTFMGRNVSAKTQMWKFATDRTKPECMIVTRGTMADGSTKAFILYGANATEAPLWFCENGAHGTLTIPKCVYNGNLADYIAMQMLVIPGVATFEDVYTTTYRGNSNSQIINTDEGTFASFIGNSAYTQMYIKCPEVSQ